MIYIYIYVDINIYIYMTRFLKNEKKTLAAKCRFENLPVC